MAKKNSGTYFYKDKPLFGLDIGFGSVKVMQINDFNKQKTITGYGVTRFEPTAVKDGVIDNPEEIAKAVFELFNKKIIGEISTRRVAVCLPASKTFTRTMTLPKLSEKDMGDAVRLEAEQYIPMPIDELYMDYDIINQNEKEIDLLVVATPKKIVDSYMQLMRLLDLEPVLLESTVSSSGRLFILAEESNIPTVLIDFGSTSAEITIYNKTMVVTGTVPCGGDIFTDLISKKLGVTDQEAYVIKTKYGLGANKKQAEISGALKPVLDQLTKEIRRMMRYYEERFGSEKKLAQVVTMGGGANMPGLSEYLTDQIRIPVRMCNPWNNLSFDGLQPPNGYEKSMYATVAGLALIDPKELHK